MCDVSTWEMVWDDLRLPTSVLVPQTGTHALLVLTLPPDSLEGWRATAVHEVLAHFSIL